MRSVSNPPNPWLSTEVEYLEEVPEMRLEVFEDSTRNILSENDSPDLGFRYSLNPYRGCMHACAYCLSGETPILLGDATTKPLAEVRVGEIIFGTERVGPYRRYVRTQVLAHWQTSKLAYRVRLEDGTELVSSGDHRFLTRQGWKYVAAADKGARRRSHLGVRDTLVGCGPLPTSPSETDDYKCGYLCGIIRGDALLRRFRYARGGRAQGYQYQFRLALADLEALRRVRGYLRDLDVATREFRSEAATASGRELVGIRTHARVHFERIQSLVAWPQEPSIEWDRGFLAGVFDAEGSCSRGIVKIFNTDEKIINETVRCLRRYGFDHVVESPRPGEVATSVRLLGSFRDYLRFFQMAQIAISRKRDLSGMALRSDAPLRVVAVEPLGIEIPMFDITTGTGDFIASGVVSHNCYARPTHEYLGFGAGTDFDRKITVKKRAGELLRERFDHSSWKGELIVFSGVTDCYQPLEASYRLTRACLEVCRDYRNPVGIITKAPLIERDLDLLRELHEIASVSVTVSIPLWDPGRARALEPYVATPERRLRTIEKLARSGIDVGVNIAPLIPGIGEEDLPKILAAAAAAGAASAGYVLLRLPGSVKAVFEERLQSTMPLRAERILARIREARGGALYDSRFGKRQCGEGEYARTLEALFFRAAARAGLNRKEKVVRPPATFRRPERSRTQLRLL